MTDAPRKILSLAVSQSAQEKTEAPKKPCLPKNFQERKEKIRQAMDWLTQAFPLCFNVKEPKPLKRKIQQDILNQWVYLSSLPYERPMPSRLLLRKSVSWYATRSTYYAAFDKATHRIDLDGKHAQKITDTEKAYAQERLTAMKAYYEKHKKNKNVKHTT